MLFSEEISGCLNVDIEKDAIVEKQNDDYSYSLQDTRESKISVCILLHENKSDDAQDFSPRNNLRRSGARCRTAGREH